MVTMTTKMKRVGFSWILVWDENNGMKANDSVIMDKPYRKSRKKIITPSVSPYILISEIKNNKQY